MLSDELSADIIEARKGSIIASARRAVSTDACSIAAPARAYCLVAVVCPPELSAITALQYLKPYLNYNTRSSVRKHVYHKFTNATYSQLKPSHLLCSLVAARSPHEYMNRPSRPHTRAASID